MEIPAAEGSALPLFDAVFADIGDEQSIEQSLSTFSAHVKNLAASCTGASARSLVLLDELGAGTDPQEGVALAMALLDHFMDTGCLVLATTHHGILKNYGATRAGAQNASMGFDRETLWRPPTGSSWGCRGKATRWRSRAGAACRRTMIASATFLSRRRAHRHFASRHPSCRAAPEALCGGRRRPCAASTT